MRQRHFICKPALKQVTEGTLRQRTFKLMVYFQTNVTEFTYT